MENSKLPSTKQDSPTPEDQLWTLSCCHPPLSFSHPFRILPGICCSSDTASSTLTSTSVQWAPFALCPALQASPMFLTFSAGSSASWKPPGYCAFSWLSPLLYDLSWSLLGVPLSLLLFYNAVAPSGFPLLPILCSPSPGSPSCSPDEVQINGPCSVRLPHWGKAGDNNLFWSLKQAKKPSIQSCLKFSEEALLLSQLLGAIGAVFPKVPIPCLCWEFSWEFF